MEPRGELHGSLYTSSLVLIFVVVLVFERHNFMMTILLSASMWTTVQRSATERTDRATSRNEGCDRSRQGLSITQRKTERNSVIIINNDFRLLTTLHQNLQGSNAE